jgi:uncharacterized membrane protein
MNKPTATTPLRLPYPMRIIAARPRLVASFLFGTAVALILPASLSAATRLLIGWDSGVVLYLLLFCSLAARSESQHIRLSAARTDEGRLALLVLTVLAAFTSFVAIVAELGASHGGIRTPGQIALAAVTVVLSWGFTHVVFALHYAHEFYGEGARSSGLVFPGSEEPDYWDFVYFAFVIGMTSQVSDVAVAAKRIRRTVTAHGIVSFLFNVALLALMVNLAAAAL